MGHTNPSCGTQLAAVSAEAGRRKLDLAAARRDYPAPTSESCGCHEERTDPRRLVQNIAICQALSGDDLHFQAIATMRAISTFVVRPTPAPP